MITEEDRLAAIGVLDRTGKLRPELKAVLHTTTDERYLVLLRRVLDYEKGRALRERFWEALTEEWEKEGA